LLDQRELSVNINLEHLYHLHSSLPHHCRH